MKVDIKTNLDIADIQKMVVECFGANSQVGEVTRLSGGLFNAAYAIHLVDKNLETILRVAPYDESGLLTYERGLMRREVAVYDLLKKRTTVPLPEIYGYNFRRDIIPGDYMFISKLNGVTFQSVRGTLKAEDEQSLSYELGQYTAQIHAVKGEYFGYFANQSLPSRLTWKAAFLQMAANLLSDSVARGVTLPQPPDEILAIFQQCAVVLDEITEPHLLHGDFWDANVFVCQRGEGWETEGIIDCDRAIWGDLDAEFSLHFRGHDEKFFAGYGRIFSDTPEAQCRRQLYLAYLYLIVCIETAGRLQATDRSLWGNEQLTNTLDSLQNYYR